MLRCRAFEQETSPTLADHRLIASHSAAPAPVVAVMGAVEPGTAVLTGMGVYTGSTHATVTMSSACVAEGRCDVIMG